MAYRIGDTLSILHDHLESMTLYMKPLNKQSRRDHHLVHLLMDQAQHPLHLFHHGSPQSHPQDQAKGERDANSHGVSFVIFPFFVRVASRRAKVGFQWSGQRRKNNCGEAH